MADAVRRMAIESPPSYIYKPRPTERSFSSCCRVLLSPYSDSLVLELQALPQCRDHAYGRVEPLAYENVESMFFTQHAVTAITV